MASDVTDVLKGLAVLTGFASVGLYSRLQARAARQLLERVQSHGIDARLEALKELAKLSADPTFAAEFINMEGIGTLARLVESGTQ